MNDTEISLGDLYAEIKDINKKVGCLEISSARIEERQKNEKEKNERLDLQINGNGKNGIIDRVINLEKFEIKVMTVSGLGGFLGGFVVQWVIRHFGK